MIDLYTAATPNGHKISIALEELSLPYTVHVVNLAALEQKRPEFLRDQPERPHPRDRGPRCRRLRGVRVGRDPGLPGREDRPADADDPKGRSLVIQWLMFQMGGIGPMMGQANVFFRYLPEKIPLAIDRYQGEVRRLFGVLDARLAEHEYLAGDYSIADIANWAWVRTHKWSGVDTRGFAATRALEEAARGATRLPARHRGAAAPGAHRGRAGRRQVRRGSAPHGRDGTQAGLSSLGGSGAKQCAE